MMGLFRDEFPIFNSKTFLDVAHKAAVPDRVVGAIQEFYRDLQTTGGDKEAWHARVAALRAKAARLTGADTLEIAFVKNTSEGLNLIANGLNFGPGDNVVVSDQEHVNNVFPWTNLARKGVELRRIESRGHAFGLSDVEKLVDGRTRVISLSHVCAATGFRIPVTDIGAFCRRNGIAFVLDAVQSVGAMDIDVRSLPVDALATSGHKWLLGPYGLGFLYCRAAFAGQLTPVFAAKLYTFHEPDPVNSADYADARRWEVGSPNYSGVYALDAALDMILSIGTRQIEAHIHGLARRLRESLESLGISPVSPDTDGCTSGIVSFAVDDPKRVLRFLQEHNVLVSVRGSGWVRVSIHFYNNEADIDRLVDVLRRSL